MRLRDPNGVVEYTQLFGSHSCSWPFLLTADGLVFDESVYTVLVPFSSDWFRRVSTWYCFSPRFCSVAGDLQGGAVLPVYRTCCSVCGVARSDFRVSGVLGEDPQASILRFCSDAALGRLGLFLRPPKTRGFVHRSLFR